jgi:hypothetical protein
MRERMQTNPYRIEGPALINVSGGRTSGFMLFKILDAYGGSLPDDVVPTFQNTGLEHPATYMFLQELSKHFCPIQWLEYTRTDGAHSFKVVDFCSASRNGEPFAELIGAKKMLPNPVARFCTAEMKVRTSIRYAKSRGWNEWASVVGLRYDEPRRVHRLKGDIKAENVETPMYDAKHTRDDVLRFWSEQPFDLMLPGNDDAFGNCVGCFLKGRHKLAKVAQSNPANLEWWAQQEERTDFNAGRGGLFRSDRPTYRQMLTQLSVEGRLFEDHIEDESIPCMCTD